MISMHCSIYCTTVKDIRSYDRHPLGQTVPKRTRAQDSTSQHSALSVLQLFIESKVTGPAMRHHPHQMVQRQNSPLAAATLRAISKHCLYSNISYLCYFFLDQNNMSYIRITQIECRRCQQFKRCTVYTTSTMLQTSKNLVS